MGYTPDYVFEMPARRFFAMRISLERIEEQEHAMKCLDYLAIQSVTGVATIESYNEALDYFKSRAMDRDDWTRQQNKSKKIFDSDDPEQNKYAAHVVMNFFKASK